MNAELALARRLANEAGALLRGASFAAHSASQKATAIDLVTEYDRRSEALIVAGLSAGFPADAILAEESGARPGSSGRRWLIDPLDGTTNFAHGLPFFCISIGLEESGVPQVGVVEAPALGWSFWGSRNEGAFFNGKRLAVSRTASLDEALLVTGFPYDRRTTADNNLREFSALELRAQGVRRIGAAALDLAMVAAGWFDGYWEGKLQPWDWAAGMLLVQEAGGRLSTRADRPFLVEGSDLVATNGHIHDALVAALAAVRSQP